MDNKKNFFEKIKKNKLMFWSLEILIAVMIVFFFTKISFIFLPILQFISILFTPILIAGFLYFLLNPLVNLLIKIHIPKGFSILISILVLLGIIVSIIFAIVPNVIGQVTQLIVKLPTIISSLQKSYNEILSSEFVQKYHLYSLLDNIDFNSSKFINGLINYVSEGGFQVVTSIGGVLFTIISIPVILIYFLIDGDKFIGNFKKFFPRKIQGYVVEVMNKMGNTIQSYILGQLTEALFMGISIFICYSLIKMPYAFLLGFIAGICTLIPYVGSIIAIIPALIIASTISVQQLIAVLVIVVIISQIDGNLVYPNLIGRNLKIHPLTIILLLYVSGNLFGILGTIIIVPVYGVLKTVFVYILGLIRKFRSKQTEQTSLFKNDD